MTGDSEDTSSGLVMDSADATVADGIVNQLQQENRTFDPKLHYGVRYLIYSWTSFAFSRRSFSLLSRASRLAAKVGLSMDQVFTKKRQKILDPLLWGPSEEQVSTDATLRWADLPQALLRTCGIDPTESYTFDNRYIWVREAKEGDSRFLTSLAFRNEIASDWSLHQTWKANEKSIIQVLTKDDSDNEKFSAAVEYQMARYVDPQTPPERIRVNGFRVAKRSMSGLTSTAYREMDLLYTFEILSLEHSFYLAEFVAPDSAMVVLEPTSGESGVEKEDPLSLLGANLDDLEMDGDLKDILALITD